MLKVTSHFLKIGLFFSSWSILCACTSIQSKEAGTLQPSALRVPSSALSEFPEFKLRIDWIKTGLSPGSPARYQVAMFVCPTDFNGKTQEDITRSCAQVSQELGYQGIVGGRRDTLIGHHPVKQEHCEELKESTDISRWHEFLSPNGGFSSGTTSASVIQAYAAGGHKEFSLDKMKFVMIVLKSTLNDSVRQLVPAPSPSLACDRVLHWRPAKLYAMKEIEMLGLSLDPASPQNRMMLSAKDEIRFSLSYNQVDPHFIEFSPPPQIFSNRTLAARLTGKGRVSNLTLMDYLKLTNIFFENPSLQAWSKLFDQIAANDGQVQKSFLTPAESEEVAGLFQAKASADLKTELTHFSEHYHDALLSIKDEAMRLSLKAKSSSAPFDNQRGGGARQGRGGTYSEALAQYHLYDAFAETAASYATDLALGFGKLLR